MKFKWLPGLPSLGDQLDVWIVDIEPRDPADYRLQFVATDSGDMVAFLENRIGPIDLSDTVFKRVDHDKQWTKLAGRRMLVKQWVAVDRDEAPEPDGDDVIESPVQQTIPTRVLSESEREAIVKDAIE